MPALSQYDIRFPLFDNEFWIKPFSDPEQAKLHAFWFTVYNCSSTSEYFFATDTDWGKPYSRKDVFSSFDNAAKGITTLFKANSTTVHALKIGTRVILKMKNDEFEISGVRFSFDKDTVSVSYILSTLVSRTEFNLCDRNFFRISELEVIEIANGDTISYPDAHDNQ